MKVNIKVLELKCHL